MKKILYIDMDNVLVDFLSAIQRLPSAVSGHVRQPSDLAKSPCGHPVTEDAARSRDLIG
jgi:hypothetical protein